MDRLFFLISFGALALLGCVLTIFAVRVSSNPAMQWRGYLIAALICLIVTILTLAALALLAWALGVV